MTVTIQCPRCGASYPVEASKLGKRLRCACGEIFQLNPPEGDADETVLDEDGADETGEEETDADEPDADESDSEPDPFEALQAARSPRSTRPVRRGFKRRPVPAKRTGRKWAIIVIVALLHIPAVYAIWFFTTHKPLFIDGIYMGYKTAEEAAQLQKEVDRKNRAAQEAREAARDYGAEANLTGQWDGAGPNNHMSYTFKDGGTGFRNMPGSETPLRLTWTLDGNILRIVIPAQSYRQADGLGKSVMKDFKQSDTYYTYKIEGTALYLRSQNQTLSFIRKE